MKRNEREARMQRRGVWLIVAGQPVQVSPDDVKPGDVPALAQRLHRAARDFIEDEEEIRPLSRILNGVHMDREKKLSLVSGARSAPQRENALSALRRAAKLVGTLRKCKHCPEEVCVFRNGAEHIIVNAASGLDHEGECIGRTK